jgi:hypothetical protein
MSFIFILWILTIFGCESCSKAQLKKNNDDFVEAKFEDNNQFIIDPEAVFKKVNNFLYKSELTVTLSSNNQEKISHEIIEARAKDAQILLKKKIDSHNFFEIFYHDDSYLVKMQNGSWRKSWNKNHQMKMILKDGLNITSWIIEQFSLLQDFHKISKKENTKILSLKEISVSKDCYFVKNLLMKFPQFSLLKNSVLSSKIILDEKTQLPTLAYFKINILGSNNHWLKINAKMSLDLTPKKFELPIPKIGENKPFMAPVKVVPKFNELLQRELGNG